MDFDAVAGAIKFAEAQEIAPRFRKLSSGDVEEKTPGEIVTAADRACEVLLTPLLRDVSDVPVVGEEAAASNSGLVGLINTCSAVWLLDPLDGTSNFANGLADYSVMVAYVENGLATSSWMWNPSTEEMSIASSGAGAWVDGVGVEVAGISKSIGELHGVVKTRFLPEDVKATVMANEHRFCSFAARQSCAGVEYPSLVAGDVDFLVYWRTLPWDHAPGVLFCEESGFRAVRPDGGAYRCGSVSNGLVVAHRELCDEVRRSLFAERI